MKFMAFRIRCWAVCCWRVTGGEWRYFTSVQQHRSPQLQRAVRKAVRMHPTADGVPTQQVGPPSTTADGRTAGYYNNRAPTLFSGSRLGGSQNCCSRVDGAHIISLYYYVSPVNVRSASLAPKTYVGAINKRQQTFTLAIWKEFRTRSLEPTRVWRIILFPPWFTRTDRLLC